MVENLNFFVAPLLLALFGLPAGFAGSVRRESPGVRFALMFMTGTVAFVVWETTLSLSGIRWSMTSVALPLGAVSIIGAWLVTRESDAGVRQPLDTGGWDLFAACVGLGSAIHLVLAAATARATSIDFFYFWGVKAVRFAEAGGFDVEYLASSYAVHAHTPYPPLVPLVLGWGVSLVGQLPWKAGLISMVIWILLAYPIVLRGLRSRLPVGEATLASGVWLVGMSLAVTKSLSAGNAEPPLLFFSTVAIVALISKRDVFPGWVVPIALAGIVLTKSEGVVVVALVVTGFAIREFLAKSPLSTTVRQLSGMIAVPIVALSVWIAFEIRNGLPTSDPTREAMGEVVLGNVIPATLASIRHLEAGSGWLAWLLVALVTALSWRGWKTILPALAVTIGILGFLLVYYLHYKGDALAVWVTWTFPRVSLTALSAGLLGAAVASGESSRAVSDN